MDNSEQIKKPARGRKSSKAAQADAKASIAISAPEPVAATPLAPPPATVELDGDTTERRAPLETAQAKLKEMRDAGWTPIHLNPVQQANASPNSLKKAIKAYCWVCVGADADPGAKQRVRDCSVGPKCPLFPHRPWQNLKDRIRPEDELLEEPHFEEDDAND